LFEGMVEREPYLWGKYKKDKTQLYTSAGMGHWFPFRLNCPPEAPLIELKKV
jgi:predicted MPP superfamily phosphohydrolase